MYSEKAGAHRQAEESKMRVFQVAANIKELGKKKKVRNAVTLAAVVLSALLQSFVIQVFIRPAGLLSGGFTGIAILIDMVTSLFGHSLFHLAGHAGSQYTGCPAVQPEHQPQVYRIFTDSGCLLQPLSSDISLYPDV